MRVREQEVPPGSVGGVFTARMAYAAGLTWSQVRTRLGNGAWRRLVGDGLVVSSMVVAPRHVALAAALTWPDSVVAWGTAARVHRLPVDDDGCVHVLVPTRRAARGALQPHLVSVAAHEAVPLGPGRITTRERTILDCLGRLPRTESDALLAWVASRDLLSPEAIDRWLVGRPGAWGNVRRRLAAERLRSGAVTVAEERLHALLRAAGITGWRGNVPLFAEVGVAARADVYFPAVRLVVEVDGRSAHGPGRFQADRERQNLLVAAGCTVLRFTWHDLTQCPERVVRQIRDTIALLNNKPRGLSIH